MKRWIVPGLPFLFSLALSLSTVGTHPYWQDSGLYLTAVKDLGVLYPPGFGLYLLLCKAWTLLLFLADFTLAVHLFSSLCAALAAGTLAVAVRDLLRSRGKIFKVLEEDPGELAGACGILAGVLLACGYTFWATAIYAKGYSLYYFILALLLWRMIRADESGRPRDFTIVAALIGLAWQAHPSAALTGAALAAFVAVHAGALGAKGVAGRTLVAAACAVGPSILILPILMAGEPWLMMGHPESLGQFADYVAGRRFLRLEGVFGYDAARAASFGQFLWEELLGVGLLFTVAGLASLVTGNRKLLLGILLWMVPYAAITILFKIEGQHDCWFVASWMPLSLALGVGACRIAMRAGSRGRALIGAAGVAAAAWAILLNFSYVSQRNYELAEVFGRTILEPVDPGAVVILSGDDANALAEYLQRVRGARPDVALVTASFLCSRATGTSDWYDDLLRRRHPFLFKPDYELQARRFPNAELMDAAAAAFLNANAECGRPLFTDRSVSAAMLRPEVMLTPAGTLWKLVPRGPAPAPDIRYWTFPIEPEQVRLKVRRERGQTVQFTPQGVVVKPQGYEWRLISMLLRARLHLALAQVERGQFAHAARLLESIVALDEDYRRNPEVIHFLGICLHALGQDDRAEPLLRQSAELGRRPEWRATALFYRGEIARKKGDEAGAQRLFRDALATPGLGDAYREEMEKRLKSR
jgi:tetratricopeptide (TPR) repeat protein